MSFDVKEVRELAKRFTPEQIESCLTQQLESGRNICLRNESSEFVISELAKAQFIREKVERGVGLADALRELARRMRVLQERTK